MGHSPGTVVRDYVELLNSVTSDTVGALSAREREVVQLIAEGVHTRDIARTLSVSAKTIESHRKRIMNKLGIHSIAELTRFAIRERLTNP